MERPNETIRDLSRPWVDIDSDEQEFLDTLHLIPTDQTDREFHPPIHTDPPQSNPL